MLINERIPNSNAHSSILNDHRSEFQHLNIEMRDIEASEEIRENFIK